jgi:DNA-binding CsgD family transcriptional regulator
MAWVLCNQSLSYFSLGRWELSERAIREAEYVARSRKARGLIAIGRARLHLVYDDTEQAERELEAARELIGSDDPQPQFAIGVAMIAVWIASAQSKIAEARAAFTHAVTGGIAPGIERYALPLLYEAAAAEAGARMPGGDAERDRIIALIRHHTQSLPLKAPVWQAYQLMIEAELAHAEGRPDPDAWSRAISALAETGRPLEQVLARARWAEAALAMRIPRSTVAPMLAQARDAAATLGARSLSSKIAALAARAGLGLDQCPDDDHNANLGPSEATPAIGPVEDTLGLTARETEVLRLIARGYTNGRIASALFISHKTVSTHVSHILAKLEATSRTEAAAMALRLGLAT